MRWILLFAAILVALLLLLAIPLYFTGLTDVLAKSENLFSLLRLYLMTCAFIGALWAIYVRDTRLRANSDNVLVTLVGFVFATIILIVSILIAQLSPATSRQLPMRRSQRRDDGHNLLRLSP